MLKSATRTVWLLVLLHIVAGLVAARCFDHFGEYAVVAFFAVIFAQAGLLGILAGLSVQSLPVRLLEAAVGLTCLCLLVNFADPGEWDEMSELVAVSFLIVAGVLGVLRWKGIGLRRFGENPTECSEPFQFGIRHLLAWILATAVLVKLGQTFDPRARPGTLFAYGLSFAAVPIAAPWAVLGNKHPVVRGAILVVVAASMGFATLVYRGEHLSELLSVIPPITALDALIVLASLGLLRRTGLRLVRRETALPRQDIAGMEEPQC